MIDIRQILGTISHSNEIKAKVYPILKTGVPNVAFRFWERFLENSKAFVLLLQSGFINEAIAIQRLSIENFAYAIALLRGKLTEQQLRAEMDAELPSQAKRMRQDDEQDPILTPENRERLVAFLDATAYQNATDPGINTYNALNSCNLGFIYTQYRLHSIRAAHATLLSAASISTAEEIEKLLERMQELLKLLDATAEDVVRTYRTPTADA